MKTLVILAVILGVLFLYFVATAEKSLIVKGRELVPAGIDIPKLILDKAREIKSRVTSNENIQTLGLDSGVGVISSSGPAFIINKIKTEAGDLISNDLVPKVIDTIKELIKSPIENKVDEFLCPQEQK